MGLFTEFTDCFLFIKGAAETMATKVFSSLNRVTRNYSRFLDTKDSNLFSVSIANTYIIIGSISLFNAFYTKEYLDYFI